MQLVDTSGHSRLLSAVSQNKFVYPTPSTNVRSTVSYICAVGLVSVGPPSIAALERLVNETWLPKAAGCHCGSSSSSRGLADAPDGRPRRDHHHGHFDRRYQFN